MIVSCGILHCPADTPDLEWSSGGGGGVGIVADMDNNTDIEKANQIQYIVQRIKRKCEKENYIEELQEEENPTKKKKQQEVKKC